MFPTSQQSEFDEITHIGPYYGVENTVEIFVGIV